MARRVIRQPLVARGARFEPWPLHVRFVLDEVALEQIFLFVSRFFPVTIIPRMSETHIYINTAVTKMKNDDVWES